MTRSDVVDWVGTALLLVWVLASVVFAVQGAPSAFQRMGAFGVAVAVGVFALVGHGYYFPKSIRERLHEHRRTTEIHARHIHGSHQKTASVAAELQRTRAELGLPLSQSANALSESALDQNFELGDHLRTQSDDLRAPDRDKTLAERREAWVVVVATLQWGFGDLFVQLLIRGTSG